MDCLENIKFLDALDQPIHGLSPSTMGWFYTISDYITPTSGESVWVKRPIGTIIGYSCKNIVSGEYKSKLKIQLIGEKDCFYYT